ncbi:tetratricopeptide repeat protein [Methanothermobacter thermautotrophicus]|jgi:tetratricopeptide (TPR) repeat protein|uniref:Uncharacterized protein n=1 Tax=Methanothermobacter thermautotrophicus (strain ATCC 29096 / DSM 1053 / JCM 10044 / NBRC 100330 / Delta H) TaxID=187420 RepID=O34794_METTH|nr:tetratricopeptide repeat protein [Methanothermobacter thermautotrophicus]AAB84581.1 unknown [Methanothermobacter thermautotrophicus str. Delta H]AAB84588.1 unknown [Methanothermobacter thermautotrophicus str. Delta H]
MQGKTLQKLGKHKEALKCYEKALKIDPEYKKAKKALKELTIQKKSTINPNPRIKTSTQQE